MVVGGSPLRLLSNTLAVHTATALRCAPTQAAKRWYTESVCVVMAVLVCSELSEPTDLVAKQHAMYGCLLENQQTTASSIRGH